MSSLLRTIVLSFALVVSLAACSPGFFASPADQQNPMADSPSTPASVACDDLVTQAKIDRWVSLASEPVAGLRGGTIVPCGGIDPTTGGPLTGYSTVIVTPTFSTSGAFNAIEDGFEMPLQTSEVAPQSLSAIADALKNSKGQRPRVTMDAPSFSAIVLGELPATRTQVEANVVRFYVPASLREPFQERLQAYANKTESLAFYSMSVDYNGQTRVMRVKAAETVSLKTSEPVSVIEALDTLWARVEKTNDEGPLAYEWMAQASQWWPKLKKPRGEASRHFARAAKQARDLWAQAGSATDSVGARLSLAALRFLAADGETRTKAYSERMKKLESSLRLGDDALYGALMDLTVRASYTADQESKLFETAVKILPLAPSADLAWQEAREVTTRLQFNAASIASFVATSEWLNKARPGLAIAQIKQWIFDQSVDVARLDQLRNLGVVFTKYEASAVAADRAIDFVITRRLESAQTEAYGMVVDGLAPSVGMEAAVAKAEDYLFQRQLSAGQVYALGSTIKWLKSTSVRDEAVERAEEYVLIKQLDPNDVLRIQKLWYWLQNTSRNLVALKKSEEWVIDRRLSAEQTDTIKKAYDWLAYTAQGSRAFDKAEDFVINRGVTIDQVVQMREIESWLRSSSVGPIAAVDKAEDYVLNRKSSRAQTDLLGVAYLWLKTTPKAADAVTRAEEYVYSKGLTIERFNRLREAFDRQQAAGDPDALATAENESLPAPEPAPPAPTPGDGGWWPF